MNLTQLKKHFEINDQEFAKTLLAISLLDNGEELRSRIGNIKKVDDKTFSLSVDKKNLSSIIQGMTDEQSPSDILIQSAQVK